MTSYQKLIKAVENKKSALCIGLDPDVERLPAQFPKHSTSVVPFCKKIINSTSEYATAYKINFAFFERFGSFGYSMIEEILDAIPDDIFTIADGKRADIGNTSKAYADSVYSHFKFDSVTLSPYMGRDSIEPFLDYTDKISIVLALTSNAGSEDFQRLRVNGMPLYLKVIETANTWADFLRVAYVVGATHPEELSEIRSFIGNEQLLLIPGIGSQGGDLASVMSANQGGLTLINSSRSIIFASSDEDFAEAANREAFDLYQKIKDLL